MPDLLVQQESSSDEPKQLNRQASLDNYRDQMKNAFEERFKAKTDSESLEFRLQNLRKGLYGQGLEAPTIDRDEKTTASTLVVKEKSIVK